MISTQNTAGQIDRPQPAVGPDSELEALRLKAAQLFRPGTVVTNVPYHLRR